MGKSDLDKSGKIQGEKDLFQFNEQGDKGSRAARQICKRSALNCPKQALVSKIANDENTFIEFTSLILIFQHRTQLLLKIHGLIKSLDL
jgi:hypothetical protein